HRDARGFGAADRNRRGARSHQFITWRSQTSVRGDLRQGVQPLWRRIRRSADLRWRTFLARRNAWRTAEPRQAKWLSPEFRVPRFGEWRAVASHTRYGRSCGAET